MSLNKQDNTFGKNYWLALALSMGILLSWNHFFVQPNKKQPPEEMTEKAVPQGVTANVKENTVLSPAEGRFIDPAVKPAILKYENENYSVELSTLGATVTRLFYKGEEGRVLTQNLFYEGAANEAGIFGTRFLHDATDLSQTIFRLTQSGAERGTFQFVYEKPNDFRLTKQYLFGADKPVIGMDITIENLGTQERHFPVEFLYATNYELSGGLTPADFQSVARTSEKLAASDLYKNKKGAYVSADIQWTGILKKYFAVLAKPDWKSISLNSSADATTIRSTMTMEPLTIPVGGKAAKQIFIYVGPQRYETLRDFNMGFEEILSRGFFGIFKIWLLMGLKFLFNFSHNYGWAIILLTMFLKLLFTPLTHMSFESMKKMQALQPRLKSIQERHKKDPTKLNREMMELYRRNRVNPMMGCLPMVLQIPIFIAFYQVLNDMIELKGAPFIFWIHDLAAPDRLFVFPFTIPLVGDAFNLLPILMLGSMVWQQQLTPQTGTTPEQTKMMAWMPVIFGFMFYKMPAGLVLYWFVNNMLSIAHQTIVKRMVVVLHHEDRE